jgi:glycosyltransferase involved in cell wall biosynthesis
MRIAGHSRPRVLVLRSNPIAPDPRVEKIARALQRSGYSVTALGWDRSAQMAEKETVDGFTIIRMPIHADFGSGLANLPNLLRWQWRLFTWLTKHHTEFDLIHACDFDTILPALWCKRRWGQTVVYDIFDFYADHLRRTPVWIKNWIRTVDLNSINRADALILVDDARIAQIAGSKPKKLVVVYNSPEELNHSDRPIYSPSPASELRIAYVGLLQVERGLFEMLNVVGRHPNWHLDLAGFGGDEKEIAERANGMANVVFHGRVAYATALALSQAADVLFATYDPSIPNHRFSSPNKVFEAMMLGKPIIVAYNTNMDRIISMAEAGLVVAYGDEAALETALTKLADDPSSRQQFGQHARAAYDQMYSWHVMESRLRDLYSELTTRLSEAE